MIKNFNIIFSIVGKKYKYFFYFLIFFMGLAGILELFGISLLIPLMGNLLDANLDLGNSSIGRLVNYFDTIFDKSITISLVIISLFFVIAL